MTHDDLIELYRRAGANQAWLDALSVSYRAGANAEREACAKVCEAYQDPFAGNAMADAIRARGEA